MNDPTAEWLVADLHNLAYAFYKTDDVECRARLVYEKGYREFRLSLYVKGKEECTITNTELVTCFRELENAIDSYAAEEHAIMEDCQAKAELDDAEASIKKVRLAHDAS